MNDPRVPFRTPPPSPDGEGHGPPSPEDYSATALASHWSELPDTPPDAVEGTVLRFGPGVTAAARERYDGDRTTVVWHTGTLPGAAPPPARGAGRSWASGLRRYALAAVILLAVLLFLGWQRFGPGPTVRGVAVDTDPGGPGCDGTAVVTAVVRTDGRPGALTYRWVRSDGTASEVLTERMARGQDRARLRLLWTFHGEGAYRARAELRLSSPSRHDASAEFLYTCP
ncbi:hypothetical protein QMZ92_07855 [Streptomyces sp. HNM0645]|uniref:hypothetical protein n=1 Tax=Streptomyces sp. HNM0645 TaxID=2782343 RepID=UPI0024B809C8|nr:hypothetical protein [Streptomyces sp. HNM0645]MDI9884315.1 hypothetical protein [Streptomyces sp. HNM0645]